MGIVIVKSKITDEELKVAREEYGDFIKVVVDIKTGVVAAGGEWHADGEKILLETGSKQHDLWGGGVDLVSKQISYNSLINMKPANPRSQEIIDQLVRDKVKAYVKLIFGSEYE